MAGVSGKKRGREPEFSERLPFVEPPKGLGFEVKPLVVIERRRADVLVHRAEPITDALCIELPSLWGHVNDRPMWAIDVRADLVG